MDFVTGRRVVLGSFYFVPIAVAAWFVGARTAASMAVLAVSLSVWVNHVLPPVDFRSETAIYWDDFARLALYAVAGVALAKLRDLQDHLAKLVDERTRELLHANEELQAVGYAVAHNLRAPLRTILRHGDDAAAVRGAVDRMARLIDGLLALTRLAAVQVRRQSADLSAAAREAVAALPPKDLRYDVAEGVRAQADPELVGVLLRELLRNAWKFTPPGGTVSFGEGPRGVFWVRDSGAGFEAQFAHKLFEPFQTLHGPSEAGLGIGLPLASRIVRRHGGRVWAQSEPGKGATFYFTLQPEA